MEILLKEAKPDYRRMSIGLFLAGFATFSMLYCVQPLLPIFSETFLISPAESSLSLSLATGFLAFAIFCAAPLSERFGRRGLMFVSIVGAACLNIAAAFVSSWDLLLLVRALEGFMLGGVPAVAMAFLAEEIAPSQLGFITGLYVAGTAFGGMTGRVGSSFLASYFSWRITLIVIGLIGLLAALLFIFLLPNSKNFVRHKDLCLLDHAHAWIEHLKNASMLKLYAIGFCTMGSFVAVYNYAGFRLIGAPYFLSQAELGLIFTVYIFGMGSSSLAGALADRKGRAPILRSFIFVTIIGIFITQASGLLAMILGIILLTIGFFGAHAVASSWVGRIAINRKGHASALYFLAYYMGSSLVGSIVGFFYGTWGWIAVVLCTSALLITALLLTLGLQDGIKSQRDKIV